MTTRMTKREAASNGAVVEKDEHYLPPRKAVHKAEKDKWVRVFYRSLLWLFIALVVGLLIWGTRYAWE